MDVLIPPGPKSRSRRRRSSGSGSGNSRSSLIQQSELYNNYTSTYVRACVYVYVRVCVRVCNGQQFGKLQEKVRSSKLSVSVKQSARSWLSESLNASSPDDGKIVKNQQGFQELFTCTAPSGERFLLFLCLFHLLLSLTSNCSFNFWKRFVLNKLLIAVRSSRSTRAARCSLLFARCLELRHFPLERFT